MEEGTLPGISVYGPVVGHRASLADAFVVHPTKRFAISAFEAGLKVPGIFKDMGYRILDLGLGRRVWQSSRDRPGGDGRMGPVPPNLAGEELDPVLCPLDPNQLLAKLAVGPDGLLTVADPTSRADAHEATKGHGRRGGSATALRSIAGAAGVPSAVRDSVTFRSLPGVSDYESAASRASSSPDPGA